MANANKINVYNIKSKPIDGFENYQIFEDGSVWSEKSDKFLKPCKDTGGYFIVSLYKKKSNPKSIHRLVAKAFIPNPENKPQINHIDNNPRNNNLSNLEWCTSKENKAHSIKQGRRFQPDNRGSKQGGSKLTEDQVINIKRLIKHKTFSQPEIAQIYQVTQSTISRINTGERWNHINLEGVV